MNTLMNEKKKKGFAMFAAMILVCGLLVTGCASRSESHRETVTNPDGQTTVVREESTTKTDDHHHGVLGSTFHVVGEIIAFPFELIANVFRFIF